MDDKKRFIVQVLIVGLSVSILGGISSSIVGSGRLEVSIVAFVLLCVCAVLGLINYEPKQGPRQIELAFIERMQDSWIDHLKNIEKLRLRELALQLRYSNRPDAVESPLDTSKTESVENIIGAFEEAEAFLLILGKRGSGKTVSLLKIAQELVRRAKDNDVEPLPVVLSLSDWNDGPLEMWISGQLKTRYDLSEDIARGWILERRLIFLLDDLDMAAVPSACVRAINEFQKQIRAPGIVVCSRSEEYLSADSKLSFKGAVILEDLDAQYVTSYLPPTLDSGLINNLKQVAESPLMMSLLPLAATELRIEITALREQASLRNAVYEAYVRQRLNNAQRLDSDFTTMQVLSWLSWLADRMKNRYQTLLLVDQLQPNWLSTSGHCVYVVVSRVLGAITIMGIGIFLMFVSQAVDQWISGGNGYSIGLIGVGEDLGLWFFITGILGGLTIAALDISRLVFSRRPISNVLAENVIVCSLVFLSTAKLSGFSWTIAIYAAGIYGLAFGFTYWNRDRERKLKGDINTSHKLVWSGRLLPEGALWGATGGYLVGVVCVAVLYGASLLLILCTLAFVIGAGSWLLYWRSRTDGTHGIIQSISRAGFLAAAATSLVATLVFWPWIGPSYRLTIPLVFSVIGCLIGLIVKGLNKVGIGEKRTANQGIKTSLRTTILLWLTVGVPSVSLIWLFSTILRGPADLALKDALFFGMVSGLLFGFSYGGLDLIYRLTLRIILRLTGAVPLFVYTAFLDHAVNLGFLSKVGAGYIFYHSELRDFFAGISKVRKRKGTERSLRLIPEFASLQDAKDQ